MVAMAFGQLSISSSMIIYTVQVGIRAVAAPATKNSASKNHSKDILCDTGILVHLASNIVQNTSGSWILDFF